MKLFRNPWSLLLCMGSVCGLSIALWLQRQRERARTVAPVIPTIVPEVLQTEVAAPTMADRTLDELRGQIIAASSTTFTIPSNTVASATVPRCAAGGTDVGLSRDNNEDTFLCDVERGLFAVFDGMGAMAAGEVASAIARREVDKFFSPGTIAALHDADDAQARHAISDALAIANRCILEHAEKNPHDKGLGAAAVVALLLGNRLHLANIGDCRAYGLPQPVTENALWTCDQTLAQLLVDKGELTPKEARHHRSRNTLLAALGEQETLIPLFSTRYLAHDTRLLLCSDGLTDMLEDEDISSIVQSSASTPDAGVAELIARANEAGGRDNVTAVLIMAA